MENVNLLVSLSGLALVLTIFGIYKLDTEKVEKVENFEDISQGSKSGLGFQHSITTYPLFLNFYPTELGQDFNLSSVIRKLRMVQNQPTLYNGLQRQLGPTNIGAQKCPIIIVPSLGASKIFGKWSKTGAQPSVKKLDAYGNFTTDEQWACRDVQNSWVPLWFPNQTTGLNQTCWSDNTKVQLNHTKMTVTNTPGVKTTTNTFDVLDFETDMYSTLVRAFQALGHVNGKSLYGASYDFRTICDLDQLVEFSKSLTNLIESSVTFNGKKAILVCHGLGAVIMNFMLVNADQAWKDQYIECVFMISACFGGCPKALRVLLSGEKLPSNSEQLIIKNTTQNFTGLQLMLPMPEIYGSDPILYYRQNVFNTSKMNDILNLLDDKDTSQIYTNVVEGIAKKSLEAPHVLTYILGGINVPTESNYYYEDMSSEPIKNYSNVRKYNGDGTVPRISLEYPLRWTKSQKEPIHFRFYEGAEHSKIMAMMEPVTDILEVVRILDNKN